jgi:hypothetical protein
VVARRDGIFGDGVSSSEVQVPVVAVVAKVVPAKLDMSLPSRTGDFASSQWLHIRCRKLDWAGDGIRELLLHFGDIQHEFPRFFQRLGFRKDVGILIPVCGSFYRDTRCLSKERYGLCVGQSENNGRADK